MRVCQMLQDKGYHLPAKHSGLMNAEWLIKVACRTWRQNSQLPIQGHSQRRRLCIHYRLSDFFSAAMGNSSARATTWSRGLRGAASKVAVPKAAPLPKEDRALPDDGINFYFITRRV